VRAGPVVASAALAGVVVAGTFAAAGGQRPPFRPLDVAGVVVAVVASLGAGASLFSGVRRGAPAVVLLAVTVYLLAGYPYGPVQACLVIAMFEVARRERLRVSLVACGIAAVVSAATVLVRLAGELDRPWLFALAWTGWLLLPWSLGALVRATGLARDRLRQQGAVEERMRVAAELHDLAGHGFALVAMQAGVALLVLDEDPAQARRSLQAIKDTSTESLNALRGMLAEFQGEGDLADLVDGVRATGLRVTVTGDAAADPLVYRVVREALTNVVRHAGAVTCAKVHIVRSAAELCVDVTDDGAGCSQVREGRGLTSLRERVEARGGTFEAGSDRSGFRVRARIPT
jgi:signal transduction histidine kinase